MARETEFKYVETSQVTDDELTRLVNEWSAEGWTYDGVQFAMRESSKRPAMAFLLFTRPREVADQAE
ncbi:MAG: DUF4177 domain-containing protein [Myxococcales bacterium]|nr:DUF4177 domain-containing protein [Myxococcales bacterium]